MPTLLEFKSESCLPCKRQAEELAKFQSKYPNVTVKVYSIDTTEGRLVADKYSVKLLPTFVLKDDSGGIRGGAEGFRSASELAKLVGSIR